MFANFDQFKKATQTVFNKIKDNPRLKLSEFRHEMAVAAGFSNIQAYKALSVPCGQISVVSVMVICDGSVTVKHDFLDSPENKPLAEDVFIELSKDWIDGADTFTLDDFNMFLEDGRCMVHGCDSEVIIVHSTF